MNPTESPGPFLQEYHSGFFAPSGCHLCGFFERGEYGEQEGNYNQESPPRQTSQKIFSTTLNV